MNPSISTARLESPDAFYEALLAAHEGLNASESTALNARLVLLLANLVGTQDTLAAALQAARLAGPGGDRGAPA